MRSPKELTRAEVVRAANRFRGRGKGQNGRSLWVKESFQLARLFLRLRVFLRMTRQTHTRPWRYCGDSDLRRVTARSSRK